MPRVSFHPDETVTSSQFQFEQGMGKIVSAAFKVCQMTDKDGNPATDEQGIDIPPRTNLCVGIQRLTKDLKPTEDEPIVEQLGCGSLAKFHPGNANSSDDDDVEDLGDDVDTEGNSLFSVEGARLDKKSKISIFGESLAKLGFKKSALNGFAPNLVGTIAMFGQMNMGMEPRPGKKPATCLVAMEKIVVFPYKGGADTKTTAPATKTGSTKVNGRVPEPAAEAGGGADNETTAYAVQMLVKIGETTKGSITRAKIGSKIVTLLPMNKVPAKFQIPVQNLIKNDEWFLETVGNMGWTVEGDTVSIPAAE